MQLLLCALILAKLAAASRYSGILINGADGGTQLYDPFSATPARGNLSLGLQVYQIGAAVAVTHGSIAYFASGDEGKGPTFYMYNMSSDTALMLTPMLRAQAFYSMSMLGDDVLVCGGLGGIYRLQECQLYIASVGWWAPFAPLPTQLGGHVMLTVTNHHRPYIFGGLNVNLSVLADVITFDASMGVWSRRAPMPRALFNHRAVALGDGHLWVLVCGGLNGSDSVRAECYEYNISFDTWLRAASLNTARWGHGMSVYKDRVYVYGGQDGKNKPLSSVETPLGKGWWTMPVPMFKADFNFASVSLM